jgi:2-amino-4-hydroxy-6-hydroxymethyldihydropteridine diphosphokinase
MTLPPEENIFVGLGSNLGNRAGYLQSALAHLSSLPQVHSLKASGFYETPPWGNLQQGPFLNQVAQLCTPLPPLQLLHTLLEIEVAHGRIRTEKWGPRTLDLDLLAYGTQQLSLPQLALPHPQLAHRAFVLVPWAQLLPGYKVPGLQQTVAQLLEALTVSEPQQVAQVMPWANP